MPGSGEMVSPWRGAVPELLIAGGLVVALAVAGVRDELGGADGGGGGDRRGGRGGAADPAAAAAPDKARTAREKAQAATLSGYSHRRFVVQSAWSAA